MKSYTDIEQSKKLAEILPLESADMCYIEVEDNILATDYISIKRTYENSEFEDTREKKVIPCWSLAALFSVLPDDLKDNHFLTLSKEKDEYCCCYEDINGNSFKHTFADNPVNACCEMIIKLHEQKIL